MCLYLVPDSEAQWGFYYVSVYIQFNYQHEIINQLRTAEWIPMILSL